METLNPGILFILSIGVFGGMLGGWLFQRLRIPQVVGYLAIGLLIGQSGLKIVRAEHIQQLELFSYFALGVIGFLVGGELKLDTFRKYGRQFTAILLGEGLTAFVLVGVSTALVLHHVYPSWTMAIAGGVVLGAIASATDPASTIDVLWEYRSRGVMTTAVIAIVALDDALAMSLYGTGTGVSQILAGGNVSWGHQLGAIAVELLGALAVGALTACALAALLRLMDRVEKGVAMSLGVIMLVISIAVYAHMDVILAAMMLGFTLVNLAPRRSPQVFDLMRNFAIPIYVLFFVLVGARISIVNMPGWLWGIVALYVICRSAGKFFGTWAAARYSGASIKIQKYLGMTLFAQGGVAIGLAIMSSRSLSNVILQPGLSLADVIVFTVTATTLCVQLIGPPMVKLAINLAHEAGCNVTEDDIILTMTVDNVMSKQPVTVFEGTPVVEAMELFSRHEQMVFPVVNADNQLTGILSLAGLREIIVDRAAWNWMLTADIMTSVKDRCAPDDPLEKVYREMRDLQIEQIPVVDTDSGKQIIGLLDLRHIRHVVKQEMLNRRDPDATVAA